MRITIELEGLANSSQEVVAKITEEAENLARMAMGENYDIKLTIVST